jgi:hypothetical protein
MNSYKVASMEWGTRTEQWFSNKKEAIRFARGITRRGFEPTVTEYPNHDYSNGREVGRVRILAQLFRFGW